LGALPPAGDDAGAVPLELPPPPPPQAASVSADAIARAVSAEVFLCCIFMFPFVRCYGRTPCATLNPLCQAVREVKFAQRVRPGFENSERNKERRPRDNGRLNAKLKGLCGIRKRKPAMHTPASPSLRGVR